jgi:hypothetical protein
MGETLGGALPTLRLISSADTACYRVQFEYYKADSYRSGLIGSSD